MGTLKLHKSVYLYLLPAFGLYMLFFVYPFIQNTIYSFTNYDGFSTPAFVGFANFTKIFRDKVFRAAMGRVLIWSALSIIFKVGTALLIAYVLRKAIRGVRFFRTVVFLPYVISSSAMCLMFTIMYDKDIGLFNIILNTLGLGDWTRYWLADKTTAFYAVIFIPIYQAVGYFFVILFGAMQDISEDLYEAGKIDGTNPVTEFLRITLPCVWPTLVVCIVLAINGAFQNFDYVFIMTGGGPARTTEVPATYMYKSIFVNGQYGYGGAAAICIFLSTLIITAFVRKVLNSRFTIE